MSIKCAYEHNGNDTLLYSTEYVGAFTRGKSLEEAKAKMPVEISRYCRYAGLPLPSDFSVEIVEEKDSDLNVCDADSDMIFQSEKLPLSFEEYNRLKSLALKSARDFLALYNSVPDKNKSALEKRTTFYGEVPITAEEMYIHTKNVNAYYFGEIGIDVSNDGDILSCRERGFALLERTPDFLENKSTVGSYGEEWSLKKVLRRFIWHDRIHAKAMYKMAKKTFPNVSIPDVFGFEE